MNEIFLAGSLWPRAEILKLSCELDLAVSEEAVAEASFNTLLDV